jgi:hypothetical protein
MLEQFEVLLYSRLSDRVAVVCFAFPEPGHDHRERLIVRIASYTAPGVMAQERCLVAVQENELRSVRAQLRQKEEEAATLAAQVRVSALCTARLFACLGLWQRMLCRHKMCTAIFPVISRPWPRL